MRRAELLGHIAAFFTILVWGITFVSTKVLLAYFTPLQILFSRFLLGWLALWLMCPRILPFQGLRREILFAGAGLTGVTMYFLLENVALTYTLASNVAVIVAISPFFTAILAWLLLKTEKPGINFYAGFCLAMAGICLISFRGNAVQINPLGDFLAILAAIVWAFYSSISRKLAIGGYNIIQLTRRAFFYGIIFMLPVDPGNLTAFPWQDLPEPVCLANLVFLGVGASAICFASWNFSLKVLGAASASAYIYLVPIVTVTSARLVLSEPLDMFSALGILLTLSGLALAETRRNFHKLERKPNI